MRGMSGTSSGKRGGLATSEGEGSVPASRGYRAFSLILFYLNHNGRWPCLGASTRVQAPGTRPLNKEVP